MTALLELKQRIKNLYSQYEIYILPVLRFVLAMVYFIWINTNMGYMKQIDNIFIVLILALICSILPSGVMIFVGFALMVAHGYALGIEVAGFMLVLILFMAILFLRFSSDNNLVLVFTPLSFGFSVPTLLPIGSGLLSSAASALPAGCGVVIYYFIRFLSVQHKLLENPDVLILDEPFNGLDKAGVAEMRQLLLSLKESGKAIMLASHNAQDIEMLCDYVHEMEDWK